MPEIYTPLSNYYETNSQRRKQAAEGEVLAWGESSELFGKYREEWNRSANESYLPAHPLHVDIELSDACNLRCRMCAHGMGAVKKSGLMDRELAFSLIDQCSTVGVYSIKFNWRGESTLNPFLPDAVAYAKAKGILEVQINTNGLPPRRTMLAECAESGIDRIIFSVDGFSKETYESQRIGGVYANLVENIKDLLAWRNSRKRQKPLVRLQMVRTLLNAHEVDDFINYWQPLVDDVRVSDVTDRGQGDGLSVGDQITIGRRRCPQPFQRLVIARDGRVSPCCSDWNQEFVAGDVAHETLLQIWQGDRMRYIRGILERNEHHKIGICNNCCVKESYIWKKRD
ncbi:MAG: SPASM domain-containing protein [Nitrospirae bacterium]|nr:SPASM domain-containing protein [Nitrospirota bacterium]